MRLPSKSPFYVFVVLALMANATPSHGQIQIPEGKIVSAEANMQEEKNLRKLVDEKQLRAIQLVNVVGTFANDRFSTDLEKGEASDAYGGFIARFQGIYEDREALERKEIMPDYKTLQNYSERLDRLIADIQKFLK